MGRLLFGLNVGVFALVLLAAGCGGRDSGVEQSPAAAKGPAPVTTQATSEFADSAVAICEGMIDAASAVSGGSTPSDEEALGLVRRWRASLDELEALNPPANVRADFARMLTAYRNTTRALEALVTVDDETVLAAAAGIGVFGQRGSRAARDADLDACVLFPLIEQPPADPQAMYDATRELVPVGANLLFEDEPACGEKHGCRFEFEFSGSLASRLQTMRRVVRANGWTNVRTGRSPPATTWLMASRNDYALTVELIGRPLPEHCGRVDVSWGCVDSVWVHRIEVPEVLTGG